MWIYWKQYMSPITIRLQKAPFDLNDVDKIMKWYLLYSQIILKLLILLILKETRNTLKIRYLDFEKKNDSSTPKNVL